MNTRFNYQPPKSRDNSRDDEFSNFEYKKKMRVISTQKDGSVDKYEEISEFVEEKSSWSEFVESYNLGSVQEQVMDHITKGTPLVTAHTLPAGDYTQLEKGAEIKREMAEKGITLDMITEAVSKAIEQQAQQQVVKEGEENA